ncbi:MAG: hypothetical protein IJR34_06155, partial [Bacteroidales bacterium]|nr:hypothetical protein [Bacteroidales bacterium]
GHTLTIHTSQGWRGGLCQNLLANVQDLTITGTATITGSNTQRMCAGGLACFISKDNLTISNVTSNIYVDVTSGYHNGDYAPYIGGLVGTLNESATKATFSNCHFTGTLSSNESIEAMGGILGSGALGAQITFSNCSSSGTLQCRQYGTKGVGGIAGASGAKLDPGEILTFNNCSFSGIIDYFSGGDWVTRIGGILGNLERGAVLTDCSFTGLIKADMNNKAYFAGDSNNRGIGGLIGRDTAPVDENPNMNAKAILTDCVSNGRITVVRSADTDANNLSHIGHITGLQMNTTESHSETRCIGTNIITVNGSTISPDH